MSSSPPIKCDSQYSNSVYSTLLGISTLIIINNIVFRFGDVKQGRNDSISTYTFDNLIYTSNLEQLQLTV